MTEPASEAVAYGQELTAAFREVLGDALVSACLHGSGAMGGWAAGRSDIDILFVMDRALEPVELARLSAAVNALPCPGSGVELSIVRGPLALAPGRQPFEVHITSGPGAKVVPGAGHAGDADLVLHFAVARARGARLFGPPLATVLPEVPRARLLAALDEELAWAETNAPAHYAVLNACRAAAFAETDRLLSKLEGAAWAEETRFQPGLAAAAARRQRAGTGPELPRDAVRAALGEARARIARALERERQGS